ncbi:hypothetical protein B0J17DRAFT_764098 [Rhizoctonia solani]|nr:hypothetical protein B0J17DRAFT_764098 [Rhizoctonia solani]
MSNPPKAVLYTFNLSVWSAAAEWAVQEKGYGEDELEFRTVDVVKGESFAPSFLRINPKGTIPTLVAPLSTTLDASSETKYRALTDTVSVLDFLDKSRSNLSKTHTTSQKPAPSLSPATVEASGLSKTLIDLVHAPEVDPNFLLLTVKDESELKEKSDGFIGKTYILGRAKAMEEYLATEDLIPKIQKILEEKKAEQAPLVELFSGKASEEAKKAFFAKSKEAWEVALPKALATLESSIVGPYTLGDQLSLADLHVGVWLARIVQLPAGDAATDAKKWPELLSTLAKPIASTEFKVGPKVTAFWNEIIARDAFKKVYPPKSYMHAMETSYDPETPVDLVLSLLQGLIITLTVFPLGIIAALAHVFATLIRSIPTFIGLSVGCIVLTSAVLLASAGYALFSGGVLGLHMLLGCKKALENSARVGTNMASVFLEEWTKERKGIQERWMGRAS